MAHSWPKRRLKDPRNHADGGRLNAKSPANGLSQTRWSSAVAAPDSACHAGGRGFESVAPLKVPANRYLLLSSWARSIAGFQDPACIPHEKRRTKRARAPVAGDHPGDIPRTSRAAAESERTSSTSRNGRET